MVGDQIREIRLRAGMSRLALANRLNITQQAVGRWERGETEPSSDILQRISQIFGVSINYLFGVDEMRPSDGKLLVPVLGDVAAGIPIEAIENILDYEEIDASLANGSELVGLRIRGTSMEPRICNGDVVIIRRQECADNGDIVVALVGGESATVKKLKLEPDGGFWLLPLNPAFGAAHFSPEEIASRPVKIFGKVIELRGKF